MPKIFKGIYYIIPAYKPNKALLDIANDLASSEFVAIENILVFDDGSGSDYDFIFDTLRKNGIQVLRSDINRGKGYGLKQLFSHVLKHSNASVIVTLDADGQHLAEDAIKIGIAMLSSKDDMILGSRLLNFSDVPLRSAIGNKITTLIIKILAGKNIKDTQTGLRALARDFVSAIISIPGDRYDYEMKYLIYAMNNDHKISEINIRAIYYNSNKSSHFRPIIDSIKIYKNIFFFALSSLVAVVADYILYYILLVELDVGQAYLIAKTSSSIVNYLVNKRVVFNSSATTSVSIVKYYSLFFTLTAIGTIITAILTKSLEINPIFAKLAAESVLFFISYTAQRAYIFR